MSYEIANGTEDGIHYRCHLEAPEWIVTVTKDDKVLTEKFYWMFEPRCGPDVADVLMAEEVLNRLIEEIKK